MILSWTIETVTRTNALTALSTTIKRLKPSLDGEALRHEYVFGGAVSDADAKATARTDLETTKGYNITGEV